MKQVADDKILGIEDIYLPSNENGWKFVSQSNFLALQDMVQMGRYYATQLEYDTFE